MSPFLVFTLKTDRFQNAPFSNLYVLISVSKSSVFTAEQCERKAKTDKFCSVFMWKRSSVKGALAYFGYIVDDYDYDDGDIDDIATPLLKVHPNATSHFGILWDSSSQGKDSWNRQCPAQRKILLNKKNLKNL